MFSTVLDFYTGLKIADASTKGSKKFWLWTSIIINAGFLGVFKYYNFFVSSFADSLSYLGLTVNPWTLEIILPVGISFYTFHGLSYVIDIYYDRIKPERNFVDYGLFVSFFPLLVAGPIERATHLLPQLKKNRVFEYSKAVDGLRQILWGLFKKIVIADNCAEYANAIFNNPDNHSGSTMLLAAIMFAFQIYGDFSGYSDIALGSARLLGIELLRNFSFPYFSRDIAEFWRRWHISLSSWFRDYVYIPLGGSKGGKWMQIRNTFIIFLLSGFWHGANWTFIAWGAVNAFYFLPLMLTGVNRSNMGIVAQGKILPSPRELMQILLTFGLTVLAWILFRAESMSVAGAFYKKIFSVSLLSLPKIPSAFVVIVLVFFILVEWAGREGAYAIEKISFPRPVRWAFYYSIVFLILAMGGHQQEFIYFQF